MKELFLILGLFSIAAALVKLIKSDVWWVRMFDFPQAQLTFLGFISLIGTIVFTDFSQWYYITFVIILALTIYYQLRIIIPYTIFYPVQVKQAPKDVDDKDCLSILVVNVYQYNKEFKRCIEIIKSRNADIIIAVETDDEWERKFTSALDEAYQFKCLNPIDNTYGMLLYSKLELKNTEIKFLIEEDIPSIHTEVIMPTGKVFKLYCVHPEPPSPTENDRSTERDAELIMVGKEGKDLGMPVIVAGDLNDVAWSKSTKMFQRISGLLDPRIGRGFYNTFHAKYLLFRWPLDHIFHSEEFTLVDIRRLEYTGSDHFPIYLKLYLNMSNGMLQDAPEPEPEDYRESREKIDKAREDN